MLSEKLEAANVIVKQAQDDADVLIIETALEQSSRNTTFVGEDADLLVLLLARTPSDRETFFLQPGKGKVETKIYSSLSFGQYKKSKSHLLFLHAITGYDTTSALFNKSKTKALKLLEKREDLQVSAEVFKQQDCSPELIFLNGLRFLLAIYNAPVNKDSIDAHRNLCFAKSTRNNKPVKLASLPPTASAAQQYLYRVYYQVQKWLGNELNPEDWGWIMKNNFLQPKTTSLPPVPDTLLNIIFCKSSKGCGPMCGCRKLGLYCSAVCGNCHGQSCLNTTPTEDSSDISEEETNIEGNKEDDDNNPMHFLSESLHFQPEKRADIHNGRRSRRTRTRRQ
ncbi:hypothetical protein RF55_12673 [Lasius niger]|uniref:Uncharacterized protein n=1 Tax=Lasius niger TaxID=67767 RepID=A0A0J7N5E9_LASNI|nr:hypothetical protein RF55_12673 [Lasius niger]